jgi:hypothetical protein
VDELCSILIGKAICATVHMLTWTVLGMDEPTTTCRTLRVRLVLLCASHTRNNSWHHVPPRSVGTFKLSQKLVLFPVIDSTYLQDNLQRNSLLLFESPSIYISTIKRLAIPSNDITSSILSCTSTHFFTTSSMTGTAVFST